MVSDSTSPGYPHGVPVIPAALARDLDKLQGVGYQVVRETRVAATWWVTPLYADPSGEWLQLQATVAVSPGKRPSALIHATFRNRHTGLYRDLVEFVDDISEGRILDAVMSVLPNGMIRA